MPGKLKKMVNKFLDKAKKTKQKNQGSDDDDDLTADEYFSRSDAVDSE